MENGDTFKVVVLGEGRVGKTSITLRYCSGEFSDSQESTISAAFLQKRLTIGKRACQLNIYDTAGQERFHSLAPIYYRGAHGALLVYDITDNATFERVERWVKELKTMASKNIFMVICANKCDLEGRRAVDDAKAKQFADQNSAEHVLVSAKTAEGLEKAFFLLARGMQKKKTEAQKRASQLRGRSDMDPSVIAIEHGQGSERSCCG